MMVTGWVLGWILLWRAPRLGVKCLTADATAAASVVIPARNEADRLPGLLDDLARQTRPAAEVVVVDDDSSDGTAAIAAAQPGVTVVAAPTLPDGWTGKCWACVTGVGAAGDDVLVFLDADVRMEPDALEAALATWSERGGLLSVQPHHHIERPIEAVSLPFNIMAIMGLGVGSLARPRREWAAAGPLLVIDRETYDRVGGHAAVRTEVAEDLALAAACAAHGVPVRCLTGGRLVRFRMYRDLRGAVEGWSKNLATGARRTPRLRAALSAWWITALLALSGVIVGLNGEWSAPTAGAAYVAGLVQITVMARQVGRFGLAPLAWPLLMASFVAVFTWSAITTFLARQVRWSGRAIAIGRAAPSAEP